MKKERFKIFSLHARYAHTSHFFYIFYYTILL